MVRKELTEVKHQGLPRIRASKALLLARNSESGELWDVRTSRRLGSGRGVHLGLPAEIGRRPPIPDPGLFVQIPVSIIPAWLAVLGAPDDIIIEEIRAAGWYNRIAQAFGVLLPISSVGVMGDDPSYAGQQVLGRVAHLVPSEVGSRFFVCRVSVSCPPRLKRNSREVQL